MERVITQVNKSLQESTGKLNNTSYNKADLSLFRSALFLSVDVIKGYKS